MRSKSQRVEESKGQGIGPLDPSTLRPLDKKISDFFQKHHVATLATSSNNTPWVAHCFYAFMEKEMCLVFTTDTETRHGQEMTENQNVSVGIAWETKIVGQIRGAQCSGRVYKVEKSKGRRVEESLNSRDLSTLRLFNLSTAAKSSYLRRFPYAALMKTQLWIFVIESIKYTDNRLGFGKKLYWEREAFE
jgi:uncharacterized protein YhbP (UPF0306 family)